VSDIIADTKVTAYSATRRILARRITRCFQIRPSLSEKIALGADMTATRLLAAVLIAAAIPAAPLVAHSGGVDANGCHAGSQPYHCHRGKSSDAIGPNRLSPRSGDRNCGDFLSWEDAQAFFELGGPADPHRLDADGDGIACEALR